MHVKMKASQAFRNETQELAEKSSKINLHYCYREYEGLVRNVTKGVVDKDLLQRLLSLDDYEFFLCGPPGFMSAMYKLIRNLGVAKERIKYEFFGPATVLEKEFNTNEHSDSATLSSTRTEEQDETSVTSDQVIQIHFKNSDLIVEWDDQCESILEFAEANGLTPDFSCRAGICSTCHCRMPEGDVEYVEDPLEMPDEGYVLPCVSKPKSSIVIEI